MSLWHRSQLAQLARLAQRPRTRLASIVLLATGLGCALGGTAMAETGLPALTVTTGPPRKTLSAIVTLPGSAGASLPDSGAHASRRVVRGRASRERFMGRYQCDANRECSPARCWRS